MVMATCYSPSIHMEVIMEEEEEKEGAPQQRVPGGEGAR